MSEDRKLLVERLRQLHQDIDRLLSKLAPSTARRLRKRYGLRPCDNVPEPREDMSISEFRQLTWRYAAVIQEIEQLRARPNPDQGEDTDDFPDDDMDDMMFDDLAYMPLEEPDDFDEPPMDDSEY